MNYDPENKDTFFYVDKYDMVLHRDDPLSWRDSIGRNFDAWIAWRDERFIEAVKRCFKYGLQRHPAHWTNDMSRDHVSYALILFAHTKRWVSFFLLANKLKWLP